MTAATAAPPMDVVLVTGTSGAGKGVALNGLADDGYFSVDNLPPELLRECLELERSRGVRRVAVTMDVRSVESLPYLAPLVEQLRAEGMHVRVLFLDASTETLVRRFSETRRMHPLTLGTAAAGDAGQAASRRALLESIQLERTVLEGLRAGAATIDTTLLRPAQLRAVVRQLVEVGLADTLTLIFESFAFKKGVPRDADWLFDVRMLPNPHYVSELRLQTGLDAEVVHYLEEQPEVIGMIDAIEQFLARWLPALAQDQRSYVTVAVGCTGGQHRSVFIAETLGARFRAKVPVLVRHRELQTPQPESQNTLM